MMEFFIIENGRQVGPLTIAQLAERPITSETLVWREGMADWAPAWQVQELRYILEEQRNQNSFHRQEINGNEGASQGTAVPPIPPTYNQESYQQQYSQAYGQPRPKQPRYYLWCKILGILFIVLLIVMAVSNPKKEAHEEVIRTEVSKAIDKSSVLGDGSDLLSQGFRMMARMMAGTVLDSALDQLFEYHNYIFFSKGTVTFDGKSHTVSYGFFGKVFTMNADDMVKALEKDNLHIDESSSTSSDDSVSDQPNASQDEESETMDEADNTDDNESDGTIQQRLEDKANDAVDKVKDKVRKKVEDKINQKINEVTDSSTIEKLIDKILDLF